MNWKNSKKASPIKSIAVATEDGDKIVYVQLTECGSVDKLIRSVCNDMGAELVERTTLGHKWYDGEPEFAWGSAPAQKRVAVEAPADDRAVKRLQKLLDDEIKISSSLAKRCDIMENELEKAVDDEEFERILARLRAEVPAPAISF